MDNNVRADVIKRLERIIKHQAVEQWLSEPNETLQGKTPNQLIQEGKINELYRMLDDLESGQPF